MTNGLSGRRHASIGANPGSLRVFTCGPHRVAGPEPRPGIAPRDLLSFGRACWYLLVLCVLWYAVILAYTHWTPWIATAMMGIRYSPVPAVMWPLLSRLVAPERFGTASTPGCRSPGRPRYRNRGLHGSETESVPMAAALSGSYAPFADETLSAAI